MVADRAAGPENPRNAVSRGAPCGHPPRPRGRRGPAPLTCAACHELAIARRLARRAAKIARAHGLDPSSLFLSIPGNNST